MKEDLRPGSFEAMLWLKDFSFNEGLPPIVRQIYEFKVYKKLIKSLSEEDIWQMHKLMESNGYSSGIAMTANNLRLKVWNELRQKESVLSANIMSDYEKERYNEKFEQELYQQEIEQISMRSMTPEQIKEREAPNPYKSNTGIPQSISLSRPIIEAYTDESGISYILYDKVYNVYAAIVFSARRIRDDQNYGGIIIRHHDLSTLRSTIKNEMRKEYYETSGYYSGLVPKNEYRGSVTVTKQFLDNLKNNNNDEILKIKKIMGILNDDENLNGDIF